MRLRVTALLLLLATGLGGPYAFAGGDASGLAVSSEIQRAVEEAAAAVTPALVRIQVVDANYKAGKEMKGEASGSGVIFTREGHIVTNHHVAGTAKQIVCTLANKEEIDAVRVGTDPLTDICVIKLVPKEKREFPVARFGDSSQLQVGDRVLAMGSPLALSQSVTMGIVSNTALVMPEMYWPMKLQVQGEDVGSMVRWIGHDAQISPGNSGGPLVNLQGEIVGINEIVFGLGGAIPGNLARSVAERLIEHGSVDRGWVGLEVQPLLRSQQVRTGVLVAGAVPGSPADEAGFQPGDVLVSLAGEPVSVTVPEELPVFNQMVAALPVGQEVKATVLRGGQAVTLTLRPIKREARQPQERELSDWGMTARDLSLLDAKEMRLPSRDGVLVTTLRPGGPADDAKPKLVQSDVITAVNGRPTPNVSALVKLTTELTAGATQPVPALVSFTRGAEQYLTVVKIGQEPTPQPTAEVTKAWLGVQTQVLTREIAEALGMGEATGVRITAVYPGGPGEAAGLKVGDFVVALDGQQIKASRPEHFDVFPAMIRQYDVGAQVKLTVIRDGAERELAATLGAAPKSPRELEAYRDDLFEFSVRDISVDDRVEKQLSPDQQGALVVGVSEGGWAALARLAVGDLILAVDGHPTPNRRSLEEQMQRVEREKPDAVVLQVRRGIYGVFVELRPKWAEQQ